MTLEELAERIQALISQQGADAPVAAFVYTSADVETSLTPETIKDVLEEFQNNEGKPLYEDGLTAELARLVREWGED